MSILDGKSIYLKLLTIDDITDNYVSWMNDYEIVKYTESRFNPQSKETIKQFIICANNSNNYLYGIFTKNNNTHIGNIKLGNINWIHRYGDIGIIIGEKSCWGKGVATEAISLITKFAFNHLNLHKLVAGAYEYNIGSIKAFLKNEFIEVYNEREKYYFEGKYISCIHLEKINDRRL